MHSTRQPLCATSFLKGASQPTRNAKQRESLAPLSSIRVQWLPSQDGRPMRMAIVVLLLRRRRKQRPLKAAEVHWSLRVSAARYSSR